MFTFAIPCVMIYELELGKPTRCKFGDALCFDSLAARSTAQYRASVTRYIVLAQVVSLPSSECASCDTWLVPISAKNMMGFTRCDQELKWQWSSGEWHRRPHDTRHHACRHSPFIIARESHEPSGIKGVEQVRSAIARPLLCTRQPVCD